jgi:hypothetical protein
MNEFKPKLVLDSRIHDITDRIDVAVESSAAQSTYQNFKSVNSSNSSITFNVNIPSENIAVDRRILMNATVNLTINITNVPVGSNAFEWGMTDGLGQFPLNSLFQQVQATINNVSVSVPLEDVMAPLLRLCDQKEVSKMNSTLTASYIDQNISNLIGAEEYASNPLRGMKATNYDQTIQPRGCVNPNFIYIVQKTTAGETSDSTISTDPTNVFTVTIQIPLTEPFLFLSPFNGLVKSKDEACFLGINNMNIVCNIKSNLYSLYKTTNSTYTHTVALGIDGGEGFTNPQLLMNFLTLQPEQYMSINTRNVLPIQDYPRYISTDTQTISAAQNLTTTYTMQFPIIQLNQIPDTLLIFVRPNKSTATNSAGVLQTSYEKYTQSQYLSIVGASISFNNQSGILSSCSREQLYNISRANGSQQSYSDFFGQQVVSNNDDDHPVEGNAAQGSILVLKPAYDFNLPSFLSGGSLGQFGLQIKLSCQNWTTYKFTASDMVVIAVNSGLMVTKQGSSSLYSGLLTKDMVLKVKQEEPVIDSSTLLALTGGSIQEACHTGLRKVLKKHFGKKSSSGSGLSAGGLSAGKQHNRMSKYT